jgi:hypothetical protein
MERLKWSKIDKELVQPLPIHELQQAQLVAKVTGWSVTDAAASPNVSAALVRIQPLALLLRQGDQEEPLPIVDPTNLSLKALMGVALLVSAVCWLIILVTTRVITHGNRNDSASYMPPSGKLLMHRCALRGMKTVRRPESVVGLVD